MDSHHPKGCINYILQVKLYFIEALFMSTQTKNHQKQTLLIGERLKKQHYIFRMENCPREKKGVNTPLEATESHKRMWRTRSKGFQLHTLQGQHQDGRGAEGRADASCARL